MVDHNIQMRKKKNGEWENLYPITVDTNVLNAEGKNVKEINDIQDMKLEKVESKINHFLKDLERDFNANTVAEIKNAFEVVDNENIELVIPPKEYDLNEHIFDIKNTVKFNHGIYPNKRIFTKETGDDLTKASLKIEKLFTYTIPSGFNGLQGGYFDGTHLFFAINSSTALTRIIKWNVGTNTKVIENTINAYHANDITEGHDGFLYVAMLDGDKGRSVAKVDKNTLAISSVKVLPKELSCIDYDSKLGFYVTGKGVQATIYDTGFNEIVQYTLPTTLDVPQGIAFVKNKYIFKAESHGNRITVTDLLGNYITDFIFADGHIGELEFITQSGENEIIFGVNDLSFKTLSIYRTRIDTNQESYYNEGIPYYDTMSGLLKTNIGDSKYSMMLGYNFMTRMGFKFTASGRSMTVYPNETTDLNEYNSSGFYYVDGTTLNLPAPGNHYVIVVGSAETSHHALQLAATTGSGNYKLFMRKGVHDGSKLNWGAWATIQGVV